MERASPTGAAAAFGAAIAEAPACPGVYLFLGHDAELLYVGKAASLRRRLRDHAREAAGHGRTRLRGSYHRVREVRWEEAPNEDAALVRESDLIVALRPPLNGTLPYEGRWTYLVVGGLERGDNVIGFDLTSRADRSAGRVYGCFPHLSPGLSSKPGIACSDGFTALLRLLWASTPAVAGRPLPRRISGTTPPTSVDMTLAPSWHEPLNRFLSGRSRRLLDALAAAISADHIADYMRPALARDVDGAEGFFVYGPQALRKFRLRHGWPAGPMSQSVIENLLAQELRASIGDFRRPSEHGATADAPGRRTRIGWLP